MILSSQIARNAASGGNQRAKLLKRKVLLSHELLHFSIKTRLLSQLLQVAKLHHALSRLTKASQSITPSLLQARSGALKCVLLLRRQASQASSRLLQASTLHAAQLCQSRCSLPSRRLTHAKLRHRLCLRLAKSLLHQIGNHLVATNIKRRLTLCLKHPTALISKRARASNVRHFARPGNRTLTICTGQGGVKNLLLEGRHVGGCHCSKIFWGHSRNVTKLAVKLTSRTLSSSDASATTEHAGGITLHCCRLAKGAKHFGSLRGLRTLHAHLGKQILRPH